MIALALIVFFIALAVLLAGAWKSTDTLSEGLSERLFASGQNEAEAERKKINKLLKKIERLQAEP
jgi:hypothetical protein